METLHALHTLTVDEDLVFMIALRVAAGHYVVTHSVFGHLFLSFCVQFIYIQTEC